MLTQMAGETASDPEAGGSTATVEPEPQPEMDPESEEPPKKKRKQYSQAQADVITHHFKLTATSKAPSLSQCRDFLETEGKSMADFRTPKTFKIKPQAL